MQSWTHRCCYNQKRQTGRAGSTAVRTAAGSAPPCFKARADMASTTSDGQAKRKGQLSSTPKGKLNPNKDPPLPDHLKTGISEIEECETPVLPEHFVVVDDLRYVLPYHFDFRLHAKKRMVGVPIVDLFSSEFPVRPRCEPGIPPRLMPIYHRSTSSGLHIVWFMHMTALCNVNDRLAERPVQITGRQGSPNSC